MRRRRLPRTASPSASKRCWPVAAPPRMLRPEAATRVRRGPLVRRSRPAVRCSRRRATRSTCRCRAVERLFRARASSAVRFCTLVSTASRICCKTARRPLFIRSTAPKWAVQLLAAPRTAASADKTPLQYPSSFTPCSWNGSPGRACSIQDCRTSQVSAFPQSPINRTMTDRQTTTIILILVNLTNYKSMLFNFFVKMENDSSIIKFKLP